MATTCVKIAVHVVIVSKIGRNIYEFSKSRRYSQKGKYKIKQSNGGKFPETKAKEKKVEQKTKWYEANDIKKALKRNFKPKPAKLRKSITPGTVLIILAGRYAAKRVVFLRQLPSGLLLVNGWS